MNDKAEKHRKFLRYFSLIAFTIQLTTIVILVRYSRKLPGRPYLSSTVVLLQEVVKFIVCNLYIFMQSGNSCNHFTHLHTHTHIHRVQIRRYNLNKDFWALVMQSLDFWVSNAINEQNFFYWIFVSMKKLVVKKNNFTLITYQYNSRK